MNRKLSPYINISPASPFMNIYCSILYSNIYRPIKEMKKKVQKTWRCGLMQQM